MNQVLALLLALSMMFTGLAVTGVTGQAVPAATEEAVREEPAAAVQPAEKAEKVGLPEIGETIHGFTAKEAP